MVCSGEQEFLVFLSNAEIFLKEGLSIRTLLRVTLRW